MANVKFIRGSRANYDGSGEHLDGIYFAEDTLEILMNGQSYCVSGGGSIASITLDGTHMTITMEDGSSASIDFPTATADFPGWMSPYDAMELENLSNTIRDAINNAIAGLKYDDEVESGKFVTSVTESDGVVETTKGSVTSEDGSVTVTPTDSGDIDLSVKFPEETLYTGKDAIDVTDYVVSLTLDSETEGFLSVGSTGLKLSGVQEAIDAVQSTAEEAETLAESALTEAKTYTDTEVSSVKEYVEENYIPNTEKGHNNGVAELDEYGHVLSSQLPSYVDDVLDYPSIDDFPEEGENGKIYIATDTNLTYRWSGSDYVEISASLALGTTAETAGRGDWTVAAYDHAQITDGSNPHKTTFDNLEGTASVLESITTAQSTADSAASAASAAAADVVAETERAEAAEAALESAIEGAGTDISALESAVQTAQSTADNAATAASSAQSTADNAATAASNASSAASVAQTAADNAASAASSAQSTADNATSAAATAQSTADSATTAASNAQSTADNAATAASEASSAASAAQSTADSATTAAATAQSTADSAASAAATAQSTADEALKAVEDIDLTPYVMSDEVKNVVLVSALPSSPVTTTLYLIPEE